MSVLLNSAGQPEPPTAVVRRLRALHAGLHLRYLEHTGEHWAVCMDWQPDDRRWEWVQAGKSDPASAYDIIGYLPMLCSADEAPAYLERTFRQYPKEEVQRMADYVQHFNETTPIADAADAALAEVLDQPVVKKRGRPKKSS